MADQVARQDPNQFPALIAHSGTAGTAEIRRVTADDSGALNVNIVAGDTINVGTVELGTVTVSNIASVPVITGFSTLAKQDSQLALGTTLNSLIDTLQELTQRLAPLAGAMNNTAQLRAVVTGAVTATGGGYITNAQAVAALLTQTNSLISSSRLELNNTLPVLANVNNCIGR